MLEIIGNEETYGYVITRRLNDLGFADVAAIRDDLVKDSRTYADIHQESISGKSGAAEK